MRNTARIINDLNTDKDSSYEESSQKIREVASEEIQHDLLSTLAESIHRNYKGSGVSLEYTENIYPKISVRLIRPDIKTSLQISVVFKLGAGIGSIYFNEKRLSPKGALVSPEYLESLQVSDKTSERIVDLVLERIKNFKEE